MPAPRSRARRRPRSTTATSRRRSRRSARASPSTTRYVESLCLWFPFLDYSGKGNRVIAGVVWAKWDGKIGSFWSMRVSATFFIAFWGDRDAENDPDYALRAFPLNYALHFIWWGLLVGDICSFHERKGCIIPNGILVRAFGKSLTLDLVNDGNDDSG